MAGRNRHWAVCLFAGGPIFVRICRGLDYCHARKVLAGTVRVTARYCTVVFCLLGGAPRDEARQHIARGGHAPRQGVCVRLCAHGAGACQCRLLGLSLRVRDALQGRRARPRVVRVPPCRVFRVPTTTE